MFRADLSANLWQLGFMFLQRATLTKGKKRVKQKNNQ